MKSPFEWFTAPGSARKRFHDRANQAQACGFFRRGLVRAGLMLPALVVSGPVTTVPWNGHTGAVSFTYDDARTSQLPNLVPQLDALKIKATFFIASTGTGGDFESKKTDWMKVSQNGHELANHTRNHANVPADPSAAAIITDMAKYMRGLDPTIEAVTFAYPNCNVNGKTGVGGESFIARGCGQVQYAWNTQPADWMNVQGLILTPTNSATGVSMLNSAKTGNTWVVTIIHDVKENPDAYSVTPADNKKLLDAAVANGLWIDTYLKVAAYYRAHFVMDAVNPAPTDAGWSLSWSSPHPKMPKSVPLRVKLDKTVFGNAFTVRQGGAVVPAESDGSYVIDFMKLSMTLTQGVVTLGGEGPRPRLPKRITARAGRDGIEVKALGAGLPDGPLSDNLADGYEAVVTDIQGKSLFQGRLAGGLLPIRREALRGLLVLTLTDRDARGQVRSSVSLRIGAAQ